MTMRVPVVVRYRRHCASGSYLVSIFTSGLVEVNTFIWYSITCMKRHNRKKGQQTKKNRTLEQQAKRYQNQPTPRQYHNPGSTSAAHIAAFHHQNPRLPF